MYALKTAKETLGKAAGTTVEQAKNPALGDLSVPCFSLSREQRKPPMQIAAEIAQKKWPGEFETAKAVGPYVNLFFSDGFYRQVLEETNLASYGSCKAGKQAFVLEYSQPNPGKPMHLGHIRSTIVGDVCANSLEHIGFNVKRLNYLNDRGAHIAELITALEEFKDLPEVKDEKDLLAYYVKIKKEIDSNPALKEKTHQVLEHLKDHSKQLETIREMSLEAFKRNYDALGVRFDFFPLETTFEDAALEAVQECLKKGLAKKEPDGTIITQLEPDLPNTVLLRSNGTPLYFTSDLAIADWKWKKYNFAQSHIFTAAEQNLHFKQLQLLLKRLGREYAENYHHKGFGLIKLTEGKMSSRQGRVILLEDVLNDVIEEAEKQIAERSQQSQARKEQADTTTGANEKENKNQATAARSAAEKTKKVAKAVGIGALKFGVLRVKLEKEIVFDPSTEVKFEGDTSAYVQYAHVRCCGILEKFAAESGNKKGGTAKDGKNEKTKEKASATKQTKSPKKAKSGSLLVLLPPIPAKLDLNESEKLLLKKLAEFPELVEYVSGTMQPHALCEYALCVAKAFTHFYSNSPVLTAGNENIRAQRLQIVASTKNVLCLTLKLLGIEALERM